MYVLKLPNGEWLNLDHVRRIEYEYDTVLQTSIVKIHWNNGDTATYRGTSADALTNELDMLNGEAITTSKEEFIINSLITGIAIQMLKEGSNQSIEQWTDWLKDKAVEQYELMPEKQRESLLRQIENFRLKIRD